MFCYDVNITPISDVSICFVVKLLFFVVNKKLDLQVI